MGEYDIVLVQETKWRHDNMWSDKAYHFVHSQGQGKDDAVAGLLTMISTRLAKAADVQHSAVHNGRLLHVRFPKDDAVAGLLTMISTRLAKAADVQHSAVHNGRLLHVRFPRGQVHVDVLNWYQHAVSDKDGTYEKRHKLLMRLQKCVAGMEGANHHPIEAYIVAPRTARQQHSQRDQSHTSLDRDTLLQDMKADTPSPALQALRLEAAQNIIDEDNANEVLLKAAHRCYPPPQRQAQPPEQPEALANCAKMKAQSRTAQGTFMAWRLWARFQQAHRIHKQRSRKRSKEARDDLLMQAQQAADRGNTFGLWRVVKQLAPKAPRKRLQLHRDGCILSTTEELEWILKDYGVRYGANETDTFMVQAGQAATQYDRRVGMDFKGLWRALRSERDGHLYGSGWTGGSARTPQC
eukprot:s5929_g2.t1